MTDNEVISMVARTIKNHYPDVSVEKEAVAQDAALPLFFVYVIDSDISGLPCKKRKQNFSVAVKYYSKSEKNSECYETAAVLWDALKIIEFKGKKLRAKNLEYKAIDGVLHFYFSTRSTMIETLDNNKFGDLEVNVSARE